MRFEPWFRLVLVLLSVPGCGSEPEAPPALPDAMSGAMGAGTDAAPTDTSSSSPTSEASPDAPSLAVCTGALEPPDSGDCNTLTLDAPPVAVMNVATDPPMGAGGTILDGLYWKTAAVNYTGPDGASGPDGTMQQSVLRIHCGVFEIVTQSPSDQRHIAGSFTYTTDGQCNLTLTCGGNVSPSTISRFDVTPTTIILYSYERPFGSTYTLKARQ
jgi:hypothetical protein